MVCDLIYFLKENLTDVPFCFKTDPSQKFWVPFIHKDVLYHVTHAWFKAQ